jgi:putative copper export protein
MINQNWHGLVRAVVVATALVGCGVTANAVVGHAQAASTWRGAVQPSVHVEAASTWRDTVQPLASTWR